MTPLEAGQIVTSVLGGWPGDAGFMDAAAVRGMMTIWARALADLEYAAVDEAVLRLVGSLPKMPSVSQVRAEVLKMRIGRRQTGLEAWGEVLAGAKRWGRDRPPGKGWELEDKLAAHVAKRIGWSEICQAQPGEQAANRARFIECYEDVGDAVMVEAQIAGMPGVRPLPGAKFQLALDSGPSENDKPGGEKP